MMKCAAAGHQIVALANLQPAPKIGIEIYLCNDAQALPPPLLPMRQNSL